MSPFKVTVQDVDGTISDEFTVPLEDVVQLKIIDPGNAQELVFVSSTGQEINAIDIR